MKIVYEHDIITPEEVMKYLALIGQSDIIFSEAIKHKEVLKKVRELNIQVSDEQLQEFADSYRTLRGLHSVEAMTAFLEKGGLTEDDFENFCELSLLTAALKDHLADKKRIEEYFINNRSDFDYARISIIVVTSENLASEIVIQVREDGEDFHALARTHSVDEGTKHSGGYAGLISRQVLSPDISAKVFSASAGDLLGPFQQDGLFQLILIEEMLRATLNDATQEVIKEKIFKEWLSPFLKGGVRITP